MLNPIFSDAALAPWYERATRAWIREGVAEERALACNWRHDHRISISRARDFHRFVTTKVVKASDSPPLSPRALHMALLEYYEQRIRSQNWPAFLDDSNESNFVFGHPSVKDPIPAEMALGRVINLNGLARSVLRFRDRIPELEHLSAGGRPGEEAGGESSEVWSEYLNRTLRAPGNQRNRAIHAIFDALNASRKRYPHQPSWAARWSVMEQYLPGMPEDWCACVGLPVLARDWIIVLRYTVGETGSLLRPTQIDAGTRGFHFPSPPGLVPAEGGLAMNLGNSCPALVPEFVHQQIELEVEHWEATGSLCEQVLQPHLVDLRKLRELHFMRLIEIPRAQVKTWWGAGC